jgi:hypothetical protein
MAHLNANIFGTDEGDVQVEIRRCVPGTQTYSANVCVLTEYKNAAGSVVSTIDGDTSEGTDAIYGMRSPVYVANTTTYPEQVGGLVTAAVSDVTDKPLTGDATAGGSTTTLVDSSEDWDDDEWNGYRVRDTIQAETATISATDGTLEKVTFAPAFTGAPDGNAYEFWDGLNTLTDTTESWTVDGWIGYRVTNSTTAETRSIASNTATTLTVTPVWTTEPDVGDSYVIIDGTGTLTDTSENWSDDEWNGDRIRNNTSGEIRIVDDTDGTLESVTVTNAWDTEPEVGDDYEILDITRTAEVAICVDAN